MNPPGDDRTDPAHRARRRFWRAAVAFATWLVLSLVLVVHLQGDWGAVSGEEALADRWNGRAGVILVALLAVSFLGYWTRRVSPETYRHPARLWLLAGVVCATTLALVAFLPTVVPPVQILSMLFWSASVLVVAVLLSPQLAVGVVLVEALLAGMTLGWNLAPIMPGCCSCAAALVCTDHIWPPSRLARASSVLAFANGAIVVALGLLGGEGAAVVAREVSLAVASGVLAPPFALGLIFLLQRPFDITNHVLLLELSNPNEPLLHRLQHEAPGTYYSSVIVANMAEAAAEAIGANALLARVGALYHDIGKLRHPELFSENQFLLGTQNVHGRLSPSLSTLVILAHVRDGVELAKRYALPRSIRDVIEEHHGTTMVSFFYHQARMRQSGAPLPEEQYRYQGLRPTSKESAIVMLADALQAAAKALPDPSLDRLESLVQEIVSERQQDGQLRDSALTFGELSKISSSFLQSLQGLHLHTRVEYPAAMRIVPDTAGTETTPPNEGPHQEPSDATDLPGDHPAHRSRGHAG